MLETYPAAYRDKFGEENTSIQNDGHQLTMVIRDIAFQGSMIDDWEPITPLTAHQRNSFSLKHGDLTDFILVFEMPIVVSRMQDNTKAKLHVTLELGKPNPDDMKSREDLQLGLILGEQSYRSKIHGWFEDALNDIHAQLPEGEYIKACINCAYSDYHPVGSGLFGGMLCFRGSKEKYLSLSGKAAVFQLQDQITEQVQETYLCPEFAKRVPGTGYRG